MKIDAFLSQFPNIRLAHPEDSDSLNLFFAQSPMSSSSLQLSYEREPDFFTFLNYQGESFVFCLENDEGLLAGVASLTVRPGYINGEVKNIGYLGDLRVNKSLIAKRHSVQWKKCMGSLIDNIKKIEELSVDSLITVILSHNKLAKRALVNRDENTFHYEKLANYQMLNIVTTLGSQNIMKGVEVRFARMNDLEEILKYFEKENRKKQFGYTESFLKNAFEKIGGFKVEKILLAICEDDIVGLTCLWNPSPIKKIMIQKLPLSLKLINSVASFITSVPREKKELKVQYLSFLNLSEGYEQVIANFVDFFKSNGGFNNYHLLAFSDYGKWPLRPYLSKTIQDNTALELYQVVDKNKLEDIIQLEKRSGFEMSLV